MRVLFLALEFPPISNTGVHRSAKLAKYLPQLGIEPVVLTLDVADAAASFAASLDPVLMNDLPADLPIYRFRAPFHATRTTRLGRFFRVWTRAEDSFAQRIRSELMLRLPAIVALHRPAAVYVSMPPFSSGGLAVSIADKLRLPLVVDMRDGWSHWCVAPFPTYAHWALVRRKERLLFEHAAAVVTVTKQLADVFRHTHPTIPTDRFHVISNGYDAALQLPEVIDVPVRNEDATVTIGYVGNFYYSPDARAVALTPWWRRPRHKKLNYVPVREDYLYRSPHFLFRAMSELRRREPALGNRIRFVLVGPKPTWWDAMAEEHGIVDAVRCDGAVPNARVAEMTREWDAQLCTSTKVEGGEDYALTSKTFDYVRAGRPIFGLVTRGSQRDFLAQSGLAILADPDDFEATVAALAKIARGGFALRPNREFLRGFHRRALAERMARILKHACEASDSAEHDTTSDRSSDDRGSETV